MVPNFINGTSSMEVYKMKLEIPVRDSFFCTLYKDEETDEDEGPAPSEPTDDNEGDEDGDDDSWD